MIRYGTRARTPQEPSPAIAKPSDTASQNARATQTLGVADELAGSGKFGVKFGGLRCPPHLVRLPKIEIRSGDLSSPVLSEICPRYSVPRSTSIYIVLCANYAPRVLRRACTSALDVVPLSVHLPSHSLPSFGLHGSWRGFAPALQLFCTCTVTLMPLASPPLQACDAQLAH